MSGTRKCPFCAELVQADAIKCKHCHGAIASGICIACEKKNRPQARFCGYCGSTELIGAGGKGPRGEVKPRFEMPGFAPVTDKLETASGLPVEVRCEKDGSVMVLIPAGEFWMGSPEPEKEHAIEHPRHKVYLDAFYMDKYEVTVAQFRKFCQETKRKMRGQPEWNKDDHPVVNVTWDEAKAYCEWAGKRLPTEAEWEKAARGGADTKYCFGDDESRLGEYAWYHANSGDITHPVGEKKPNQYGLFDMHGNVWEWLADWYDDAYYAKSPDKNPKGPESGRGRSLRGGSWNFNPYYLREAYRDWIGPCRAFNNIGFRCARSGAQ